MPAGGWMAEGRALPAPLVTGSTDLATSLTPPGISNRALQSSGCNKISRLKLLQFKVFFQHLQNTTHLSNVGVKRLPAHVGVERAVGVGTLPLHSRRPHALKLKEGKIFLDKNIKPCYLFKLKESDLQVAPSEQKEAAQLGAPEGGAAACAGSASPSAPPHPPVQRPGAAHIKRTFKV